jgi:hypothetical protein
MKKMRCLLVALLPLALALPALGESYKTTYPDPCDVMWGAVKAALSVQENYNVKNADETHMTADYQPKHSVHFDVSGVILQRENHVYLTPKGPGCEMRVVSNYSGWGHNDQSDFKKRVDDSLAKIKGGQLVPPAVLAPSAPATAPASGQPAAPAPQSK